MLDTIRRACARAQQAISALFSARRPKSGALERQDARRQFVRHELLEHLKADQRMNPSFVPSGQFPFLRLPPELRNVIYRLVLVTFDNKGGLFPVFLTQPALTRVNRQIRKETLGIFYAENKFAMNIHILDPWKTDHLEEHQRLRFLRSVQLLAVSGHFDLIQQLDIFGYSPKPQGPLLNPPVAMRLRISNNKPKICVWESDDDPDDDNLEWFWDVNCVGYDYTDWKSIDDATFAVEMQKLILCGNLVFGGVPDMAKELNDMSTGRICEVLRLLLGTTATEKFIYGDTFRLQG